MIVELARARAHVLEAAPLDHGGDFVVRDVVDPRVFRDETRARREIFAHVLETHDEDVRIFARGVVPSQEMVPAVSAVRRAGEDGIREIFGVTAPAGTPMYGGRKL